MKMGEDLDVILQSKCGEKSQACTLWKRSKEDGILAYFWINVWYMSTSGEGITIRTTSLMNPTTSKKDEEVMYDVQKWLDDEREMEAMGIDRLGVDYRIAAVKRICTQNVRHELEAEERKCRKEGMGKDKMCDTLIEFALNYSRDRMLQSRDKSKGERMLTWEQ